MIVDTNPPAEAARRNIRACGPSRGWAKVACLLGGVALPVALSAWATKVLTAEAVGRPAMASPPIARGAAMRMVRERPMPATPPLPAAMVAATPPIAAQARIPAPGRLADAPTFPSPTPDKAPADAGDSDTAARFFGYHEVDTAAEPVDTWNIDAASLDALATSRLVFTLFVGSDGSVLYCSVDVPERLDRNTRRRLAQRLSDTPMRPARRGGVPVPSRRRVELYTDSGA